MNTLKQAQEIVYTALGEVSALFMSQKVKGIEIAMPTEEFSRIADQIIKQVYEDVVHEAMERERQLKTFHTMELDAISCKSIEDFVLWRDIRKNRPLNKLKSNNT